MMMDGCKDNGENGNFDDKDEKITRSFYEILTTPELFQEWTSYVSDHPQTPNRLPQQHQGDRSEISLVVQLMHPLISSLLLSPNSSLCEPTSRR